MTRNFPVFAGSLVFAAMIPASAVANGQMVSNGTIQNDPAKEALCAKRAKANPVPFLIDQNYVATVRALHPDTTFIAQDGVIPELIECRVSESTGRYEPDALDSADSAYWSLVHPQQFTPGIGTTAGQVMAANACMKAAKEKVNRDGFDHSFSPTMSVYEINLDVTPGHRPGASIAGMKAERYDIAVAGKLFYKSSGPDLDAVSVSCLLSPTLDVKSIQTK
jgi:hypothetical protein